jgi:glycosyltransferase involved in cell wall biosynthesis
MSLLPLELLACGTIPIVNDGENNRLVSDNSYIAYAEASPVALADKLSEVVTKKRLPDYATKASGSVQHTGWQKSLESVAAVLERELA